MEVIEALRTPIMEPRDHLHINQESASLQSPQGDAPCLLRSSGGSAQSIGGRVTVLMPLLMKVGGRLLAADARPEIVEGQWSGHKVIVMAFPDRDTFAMCSTSAEHREIRRITWPRLRAQCCSFVGRHWAGIAWTILAIAQDSHLSRTSLMYGRDALHIRLMRPQLADLGHYEKRVIL